jgi:hypothetical protein
MPSGPQSQAAELSPAARLLGQILQSAAGAPPLATLNPATPLLTQGPVDAEKLARQLQQVVVKSGLFYESHVAEWAAGKRPLGELMGEPQARTAPGTPATEPASAQMINQQLATQESNQLVWQGKLGPDQPMRWQVGRAPDEQGRASGGEDGAGWQSGLRLRFAALGEIEATVTLRGAHLHIELLAGADAAGTLRAAAPRLEQALAAAGSELGALRVNERPAP